MTQTRLPSVIEQPAAKIEVVDIVAVLERTAYDERVTPEKLEKLIALNERVMDRAAKISFNKAFVAMMAEMPTIIEKGRGDKETAFAKHEDIVETLRPVLMKFGFAIAHSTEWDGETPTIVGELTHADGHSKVSKFRSPKDKSGSKNDIQALGSTLSYGRRYTTLDLLNIASRRDDDDGKRFQKPERPEPDGYSDWLTDMEVVAESGISALEKAWDASKKGFKQYMFDSGGRGKWEELKRRAAKKGK